MSDKDNNLLKSDILTVGSELSEKLNAIGVPNTFGKASEGKDNLMSIIRMTINGLDMTIDQIREILRDYYNKSEVNTLLNGKSDTSHNHDSAYANISHNHDNAYASKVHQHDGADVILSNNNDVDTEIGTIENDITSINGDITSLNNSITNIMQYTLVQTLASDKVKVYANSFNVYVVIRGSFSVTSNAQSTLATINSTYAPSVNMPHSYHNNISDDGKVTLTTDGSVLYNNKTTNTTRTVYQGFYYPLRSALP